MDQIKPLKRTKISDEVMRQLRQNILQKTWAAGERLPSESKLGEMFGVSRVTIRAALQKLTAIGLLETINGEGTFVRSEPPGNLLLPLLQDMNFNPAGILEMLEFREAAESLGSRLAAARGTPEQIRQLERLFDQLAHGAAEADCESYTAADIAFHRQIAAMSGNSFIVPVLDILDDFVYEHLRQMNQTISLTFGLDYHRQLTRAIADHDPEQAAAIMSRSIQASIAEVKRIAAATPAAITP